MENSRPGVLLDADGLVALISSSHPNHHRAKAAEKKLSQQKIPLFITRYVIAEVATVLARTATRQIATKFIRDTESDTNLHILEVDGSLAEETIKIFKAQRSKRVSYTDCHNIATIKKLKLQGVFSFDKHYVRNSIPLAI